MVETVLLGPGMIMLGMREERKLERKQKEEGKKGLKSKGLFGLKINGSMDASVGRKKGGQREKGVQMLELNAVFERERARERSKRKRNAGSISACLLVFAFLPPSLLPSCFRFLQEGTIDGGGSAVEGPKGEQCEYSVCMCVCVCGESCAGALIYLFEGGGR